MNTLPISYKEMQFLLAAMKDCEVFYGDTGDWALSKKIHRLHNKLQVNLNRYEETEEDDVD